MINFGSFVNFCNRKKKIQFCCCLFAIGLVISEVLYFRKFDIVIKRFVRKSATTNDGEPASILISGGLGTLGTSLSAALIKSGYHIVVLDVHKDTDRFLEALTYQNIDRKRVRIFNGDIRDYSVIQAIHQKHRRLLGLIHLAGVSREDWCHENVDDCSQINVNGTALFLQGIRALFSQGNEKPWLLYISSYLVYGHGIVNEKTPTKPDSHYGWTTLKAENVIKSFTNDFSSIMLLRIGEAYGSVFDHPDRTIPYFVRRAIAHHPIPFVETNVFRSYVHIFDVVERCVQWIGKAKAVDFFSWRSNVVTSLLKGNPVDRYSLLKSIVRITQSRSVILMPNSTVPEYSVKMIRTKLDYILSYDNIEDGLRQYLGDIRKRDLSVARAIYLRECALKATKSIDLSNCTLLMYTDLMSLTMLTCARDSPLKLTKDFSPSFRFISANGQRTLGIPSYYIQCINASGDYLDVFDHTVVASNDPFPFYVSYEPERGSMALLVHLENDPKNFYMVQSDGSLRYWDQREHPYFLSTFSCDRMNQLSASGMRDPLLTKRRELSWMSAPGKWSNRCYRLKTYLSGTDQTASNSTSPASKRPLCDRDCSLFTGCVQVHDCRCVSDRCPEKKFYPYHPLNYSTMSASVRRHRARSTMNVSERTIPFEFALQQHWRSFYRNASMPRIHVLDAPSALLPNYGDTRRSQVNQKYCFNADHIILTGLKNTSVAVRDAELVIVPFFHGFYWHYCGMQHETLITLVNNLTVLASKRIAAANSTARIVFILTYDHGGCLPLVWDQIDLVRYSLNYEIPALMNAHILQMSGDYNTNCYYPNKDVVIPPFTCLTPALLSNFSDVRRVKNVLDRKAFAFFKGSVWGSGLATRARLSCPSLWPKTWNRTTCIQHYYNNSDYLSTLNEARFCLMVAGTAGWATRLIDAAYAGCLPVFIMSSTHFPFEDILDYEKFSIYVPEDRLDTIEATLLSYRDSELLSKQEYLLLVRNVFIYEDYHSSGEDLRQKKGPLFFTLLSLRMRLTLPLS